ncbi:MAG: hydroxyacid dehydrogenase [bacterium]|nr:hydroxyacid dehydrogenase [bacterium]
MKIAFFELENWEEDFISKELVGHDLSFFDIPLTVDFNENLSEVEVLSTFIYSKINEPLLAKIPNLKFIATRSTGFDHIDLNLCKEKNIIVSNVPTYGENTVAEHCFALILTLSRRIISSVEKVRRGDFSLDDLRGFDLKGKTLGLVGTGHIGKHVVRMAHGFEMDILGYDLKRDEELTKRYGLKYVTIEDLLKNSDIISLHLPDNQQTHHFINKERIDLMKKGAYLINTSRGGLIDTEALVHALDDGKLAGAGLDVLEEECNIKEERQILSKQFPKKCLLLDIANNILIKNDKVIVTPHNAFNSQEALMRILSTTLENIQSYISQKPTNLVLDDKGN